MAAEYGLVTARRTRITELRDQGDRRARARPHDHRQPAAVHRRDAARRDDHQPGDRCARRAASSRTSSTRSSRRSSRSGSRSSSSRTSTSSSASWSRRGSRSDTRRRIALAVSTPVRGFFVVVQAADLGAPAIVGARPCASSASSRRVKSAGVHSEAELKMLLSRSTEEGELEQQEQEMLYKVFDFADKEVADVMVPRPEVVALSIDLPPEECLAAVIDSPYTRYPVYRETLDNVVGMLHVRDLFSALRRSRHRERPTSRRSSAPAYIVPETKDLAAMLHRVPAHEAAHGDRRRRVRGDAGHRHARGPARGDRRRDRGRVRPARRVRRADRRRHDQDRRHVPDRRLQRAVRDRAPTRTTTRWAASSSASSAARRSPATRSTSTGCASTSSEIEGSRIQKLAVTFVERRERPKEIPAEAEAEG